MLAALAAGKIDLGADTTPRTSLPSPKEISITLNDKVKQYVSEAEQHFDELIGKHTLTVRLVIVSFSPH